MDLGSLGQILGTFMPIVKLQKENSYLIGCEVKQMNVKGENCMVRVGGGYVTIQEYYNRYSSKQCVALFQRMNANNTTFLETVVNLLITNNASEKVIAKYGSEQERFNDTNTLFMLIASFVEEKTKNLNEKDKSKKKYKKKKSFAGMSPTFDDNL